MLLDDVRRTLEGLAGTLTPARAQQLAKDLMEPGAAKEQVAKATIDLLEWSQSNRERIRDFVSREVQHQTKTVGLATQAEVDALKKRVRDLERAAGMTASGGKTPQAKKTAAKKTATKKTAARKPAAKKTAAPKTPPTSAPTEAS